MSVLSDVGLPAQATAQVQRSEILQAIAEHFWRWYAIHQNDKLARIAPFGIALKTIRVRDIKFVFVLLFGEPNAVWLSAMPLPGTQPIASRVIS